MKPAEAWLTRFCCAYKSVDYLQLCVWPESMGCCQCPFSLKNSLCDMTFSKRSETELLFPLSLSSLVHVCICVGVLTRLRTSMFSQCAHEVNNLLSVTQRHTASWRSCGLAICCCWHFSYGASEIHVPCCCSLDIWIYDPKHSAVQRQTHTVAINVLAAWSEKMLQ